MVHDNQVKEGEEETAAAENTGEDIKINNEQGEFTSELYQVDGKGQLELNGIDTPIGEKAEAFLQADAQFKAAVENRQAAMTDLVSEMKARNIRTLKFKGDNLQYQPGHITPEKIKFVPSST